MPAEAVGFFTDSSICIGCKACEVACKEWNDVPVTDIRFLNRSYDNTGALGANTWRHVAFIEKKMGEGNGFAWLMNSDVCKHCQEAACLDVCPTGAIFRTEFDTVVIQRDVCNGCGYCIPACPFGVVERREGVVDHPETNGIAQKCTLCYDRLQIGYEPACAHACPTKSIQFGPKTELRERAQRRVEQLHAEGRSEARLYLADDSDNQIGGAGAFFLLLDEPAVYGFPGNPEVPTRRLKEMWRGAAAAAGLLVAGLALATLARK
ncbi:MAG TPA: 4Fe-4S dicluster domain-containing protein [Candidatus Dormibacteraeota bacterium]